jgi:hypothetical protein
MEDDVKICSDTDDVRLVEAAEPELVSAVVVVVVVRVVLVLLVVVVVEIKKSIFD